MDSSNFPPKAPGAVLDYAVDWSDWLAAGETITESAWSISPDDDSLVEDSSDYTGIATVIWVSGGTEGQRYTLVNHITTSAGREDERTIAFSIAQR